MNTLRADYIGKVGKTYGVRQYGKSIEKQRIEISELRMQYDRVSEMVTQICPKKRFGGRRNGR